MLDNYSPLIGKGCIALCLLMMLSGPVAAQDLDDHSQFQLGMQLFKSEQFLAARASFEQIRNPLHLSDAQFYQALSAIYAGQSDGKSLLVDFVKNNNDNPLALDAFEVVGGRFYISGEYRRATEYYDLVSNKSDKILFRYGRSFYELGQIEEADQVWSSLSPEGDESADAAYFIGLAAYQQNDFENAVGKAKHGLKSMEFGAESVLLYLSSLDQLGKYDRIIQFTESKETTDSFQMPYLASAYYNTAQYEKATKVYDQLDHKKGKQYYYAGYSAYEVGNFTKAEKWLKEAALLDDTLSAYASYYLGLLYQDQSNYQFAANSFLNTAQSNTALTENAIYLHARSLIEMEHYDPAIEMLKSYEQMYASGKHIDSVKEILSAVYERIMDYSRAMSYIESQEELSPTIKQIYQRVSYLEAVDSYNNDQFESAKKYFSKALIHQPNDSILNQTYFGMGETLAKLNKEEDALFYYLQVDKSDRQLYLKSRYGLAYAHYNLKDYESAKANFETVVQSETQRGEKVKQDALRRMGDCYYAQKDYDNAENYYQMALNHGHADRGGLFYLIGLMNRYAGDTDEAVKYFEKSLTQENSMDEADHVLYQLSEVKFKGQDYEEALQYITKLVSSFPNSRLLPQAYLLLAQSYENQGDYEKSVSVYKKIIDEYPNHSSAESAILALQQRQSEEKLEGFESYLAKFKEANPKSDALERVTFENAKAYYLNQNYSIAESGLKDYVKDYPEGAFQLEAKTILAETYYRQQKEDQAIDAYNSLFEITGFQDQEKAHLRLAMLHRSKGDAQLQLQHLHALIGKSNSTRYRLLASNELMSNYYQSTLYDSAIYYGQFLVTHQKSSVAMKNKARLILGKAYFAVEDYDRAITQLQYLKSNVPGVIGAESAYWLSEILLKRDKTDEALESLFQLVEDYPSEDQWVAESYLLMAEVYVMKEEIFQAKMTLSSLIANGDQVDVVMRAKDKLKVLNDKSEKDEIPVN